MAASASPGRDVPLWKNKVIAKDAGMNALAGLELHATAALGSFSRIALGEDFPRVLSARMSRFSTIAPPGDVPMSLVWLRTARARYAPGTLLAVHNR
jgi:hypothetical protein